MPADRRVEAWLTEAEYAELRRYASTYRYSLAEAIRFAVASSIDDDANVSTRYLPAVNRRSGYRG